MNALEPPVDLLAAVDATIEKLLDASSLGTPAAKAIRALTPPGCAAEILRRARALDNREYVRDLLQERDPGFAALLRAAERGCPLC